MASIEKKIRSGRTVWMARIRRRGYPPVAKQFARRTDAEVWTQEVERQIRLGQFVFEADRRTLGELIEVYLGSPRFRGLRSTTHRTRTNEINDLRKTLGELRLSLLTPAFVAGHRDEMLKGTRGPATVNRHLAALSAVLSVGVERGWLQTNPVRATTRCKEPRVRVRFLSDEQFERLIPECQAYPRHRLEALVKVALSSGLRRSELLALRWDEVNLDRGTLYLPETKAGRERVAFVSGEGLEALRQLSRGSSPWVFAPGPAEPQFPRKAWEAATRKADLGDFHVHDLRHTAATWLGMLGATGPELAAFLGHGGILLIDRYVHLAKVHRSEVAPRFVRRLLTV
ncbi:MAG: site-specific integrase [Thermoanaerobaculia bacterium]|nr:site-specific integrase [Thermoanaerobaculia bacterium]